MATRVNPPTRDEPIFNPVTGEKAELFRFSVVWSNYIDQLGQNSNEVSDNLEYEISGLETEIQQTQSFTAELAKRDDELDALSMQINQCNAKIAELQKQIECLTQLVE